MAFSESEGHSHVTTVYFREMASSSRTFSPSLPNQRFVWTRMFEYSEISVHGFKHLLRFMQQALSHLFAHYVSHNFCRTLTVYHQKASMVSSLKAIAALMMVAAGEAALTMTKVGVDAYVPFHKHTHDPRSCIRNPLISRFPSPFSLFLLSFGTRSGASQAQMTIHWRFWQQERIT